MQAGYLILKKALCHGGGSAGASPANQPDKNLITKQLLNIKYVLNLKLGSGKIPHPPAGTLLAHILVTFSRRPTEAEKYSKSPHDRLGDLTNQWSPVTGGSATHATWWVPGC